MRIADIPHFNRPNIRMKHQGPKSLSDAELLAIILGRGTKTENAVDFSHRILNTYNLFWLSKLDLEELNQFLEDDVKSMKLIAMFELFKRTNKLNKSGYKTKITSAQDVYNRFVDELISEKQEHFMTAYNQICENFSAIFSKLTGGGDGRLELQRPEDPFNGGVDLYIQFPGKPMRLASGASGGERSVAAIAYLLAIQRFLKAPFYLFDEIDAHLDDLNTSRLAEVLKENAVDSQFLMISLKDVMVHNADRIYGVFAQNGRSRVLALPMKEAKVAA